MTARRSGGLVAAWNAWFGGRERGDGEGDGGDVPLTSFDVDAERLAELYPLIDDYSVAEDSDAEFPNNVLSKKTVIWRNGAFGRRGETPTFSVAPAELRRCQTLAARAKDIAGDLEVGFGSEAADGFVPFYMAANTGDPVPRAISPELVRQRFAATLFPGFGIAAEPMRQDADWWQRVLEIEDAHDLARWQALRAFFVHCPDFTATAFVAIGAEEDGWSDDRSSWPAGTIMPPSTFPRLLVGLTKAGSLAGLLGWCVYT